MMNLKVIESPPEKIWLIGRLHKKQRQLYCGPIGEAALGFTSKEEAEIMIREMKLEDAFAFEIEANTNLESITTLH